MPYFFKRLTSSLTTALLLLAVSPLLAQEEEYLYDRNGNLVKDRNKGIDTIQYNHLNLMERVVLTDKSTLEYRYDAQGTKLSKTITPTGGTPTTTHYVGGVEYQAQQGSPLTLQLLAHQEGRVTKSSEGAFNYEYHLKDHLGNVRVSFAEEGGQAKLVQRDGYYPFGAQQPGSRFASGDKPNQYLYNGKEWQENFGLDFYDYHARPYDPHVARWWNQDQLAEKGRRWSPYAYVFNNPMRFIDPDGQQAQPVSGQASEENDLKRMFSSTEEVTLSMQATSYGPGMGFNTGSVGLVISYKAPDKDRYIYRYSRHNGLQQCTKYKENGGSITENERSLVTIAYPITIRGRPTGLSVVVNSEINEEKAIGKKWSVVEVGLGAPVSYALIGVTETTTIINGKPVTDYAARGNAGTGAYETQTLAGGVRTCLECVQYNIPLTFNQIDAEKKARRYRVPINPIYMPQQSDEKGGMSHQNVNPVYTPSEEKKQFEYKQ